eukprot:SAG31_NODE_4098_length_3588_cov_2.607624_2_plen_60_part_00
MRAVFNSGFVPLLKIRFGLGPKELGFLMGFIGLCYAISQLFAQKVIHLVGKHGEQGPQY